MHSRTPLLLLAFSLLLFSGCHTAVWQDVEGEIQGTWTLMPAEPGNILQFEFNDGTLTILQNGQPMQFEDTDAQMYATAEYRVEKQLNNHYVYIEQLLFENTRLRKTIFQTTDRWLVIRLKDGELYLSSQGEDGLKGEYQLHFFN